MFTPTFFKFLFGFAVLIAIGFLILSFSGVPSGYTTTQTSSQGFQSQ